MLEGVGNASTTFDASNGVCGVSAASFSTLVSTGVDVGVCIVGRGGGAGVHVSSTADAMVLCVVRWFWIWDLEAGCLRLFT